MNRTVDPMFPFGTVWGPTASLVFAAATFAVWPMILYMLLRDPDFAPGKAWTHFKDGFR